MPYFYYKKRPLCYLNASQKYGFVDVGFAKGFQLKNNLDYLIAEDNKHLSSGYSVDQYACQKELMQNLDSFVHTSHSHENDLIATCGEEYKEGNIL